MDTVRPVKQMKLSFGLKLSMIPNFLDDFSLITIPATDFYEEYVLLPCKMFLNSMVPGLILEN